MAARRGVGLTLIAVGKLIQVTLVLIAGIAALLFVKHVPPASVREWADAFAPESEWAQHLLDQLTEVSHEKLAFVGKTSFAYAALFAVEGVGLWRNKRWAEWLTILVTGSFIPFEVRGLWVAFNVAKLIALIINAAVVIYLAVRLWRDRTEATH
jgi:uncharacterized membrane protein (DUF2068 family)